MTLSLPHTLVAGANENVNDVQANFDTLAAQFPLSVTTTNFAAVPACSAYTTVAQSVATATLTALNLPSERFDQGTPSTNMHDTVTNNSRITCRVAGLYYLNGQVESNATSQYTQIAIRLNGGAVPYLCGIGMNPFVLGETSTIYRLAVSDYIELMVYTVGATINIGGYGGAQGLTQLSAVWISS